MHSDVADFHTNHCLHLTILKQVAAIYYNATLSVKNKPNPFFSPFTDHVDVSPPKKSVVIKNVINWHRKVITKPVYTRPDASSELPAT